VLEEAVGSLWRVSVLPIRSPRTDLQGRPENPFGLPSPKIIFAGELANDTATV
jgi:hypothetical protein